jgi:phage baseplate assembly protein W
MVIRDFKSVGEKSSANKFKAKQNEIPIGIKTPLRYGSANDGIFSMHFDVASQIQDNLRNLLLTNHGERLGQYNFGANLRELSLELSQEAFDFEAITRVRTAISKFMPVIEPRTFESNLFIGMENSTDRVDIKITYDVPRLEITGKVMQVTIFAGG